MPAYNTADTLIYDIRCFVWKDIHLGSQ